MRQRGLRLGAFFLLTVMLAAVIAGMWLAAVQAHNLTHPGRRPLDDTPAAHGITDWEDIRFTTPDGLTLRGWFAPPGPDADGATVIFVHGFGGNRADMLDLAAVVRGQGYGVLLFDLRNHGESDGDLTTLGFREMDDVLAAVDFIHTRPEVNPQRVAVLGHSMGGAAVLRAAAHTDDVAAVVAMSTFTSIEDNIAEGVQSLTGLPPVPFAPLVVWFGQREAGTNITEVRPVDDIAAIAPRPVLVVHGGDDPLLSPTNAERLYAAAGEPRDLLIVPGMGHGEILLDPDPALVARLLAFLDEFIGPGR